MADLHKIVYEKPYDTNLIDWLSGIFGLNICETTKRFWCSAFVGFLYTKLGLIYTKDYSMLSPYDLSDRSTKLKYLYKISDDKLLEWT